MSNYTGYQRFSIHLSLTSLYVHFDMVKDTTVADVYI